MDAFEIFSAGIRLLGLYCIGRALIDLFYALTFEPGSADRSVTSNHPFNELAIGIGCCW